MHIIINAHRYRADTQPLVINNDNVRLLKLSFGTRTAYYRLGPAAAADRTLLCVSEGMPYAKQLGRHRPPGLSPPNHSDPGLSRSPLVLRGARGTCGDWGPKRTVWTRRCCLTVSSWHSKDLSSPPVRARFWDWEGISWTNLKTVPSLRFEGRKRLC